jgi:hypothetical protein
MTGWSKKCKQQTEKKIIRIIKVEQTQVKKHLTA